MAYEEDEEWLKRQMRQTVEAFKETNKILDETIEEFEKLKKAYIEEMERKRRHAKCRWCKGTGEVGPSNDRYVCPDPPRLDGIRRAIKCL